MVLRVRTLKRTLGLAITGTVVLSAAFNLITGYSAKSHVVDSVVQRKRSDVTDVKALLHLASSGTALRPGSSIYRHYHQVIKSSLGEMTEEYEEDANTHVLFEDRKRHLDQQCKHLKATSSGFKATLLSLLYMKEADMLYCNVPKVGSTFWRRIWYVLLSKDSKLDSPFQFLFGDYVNFEENIQVDLKKHIPTASLSVLFTREPYQRLFSAYVDKFLSPNVFLWGIGKVIIQQFRPHAANIRDHCGHDVTFEEFVNYLIATPAKHLNEHYRPVHMLCDVCNQQYNIIGKLETFKNDAMFLLKRLDVLGKTVKFQNMKVEKSVDTVVDLAVRIFEQKRKLERCISFHAALIRMWRHLQISGIISKSKPFPLTPEQSASITIMGLINTVLEAYISSHDAESNKEEAFIMAYQQISPNNMEKLRIKFKLDFTLFDYDERPAKLFDKTQMRSNDFDYFDVLKKTPSL